MPRKAMTAQQHFDRGTYRKDRHGPLTLYDFPKKPPGKMIRGSGHIASKWIRNIADERAVAEGYRFNLDLAQHVEYFFTEKIKHSSGQWAGEPFELQPWQRDDVIYPLFGWVNPDTGYRRFRVSYEEIPKKNGKSALASAIGLYFLIADEEAGAECYSLGSDSSQAQIVHSEACNMVKASEELSEILNINRSSNAINFDATSSTYRALSSSPQGKHGYKIHFACSDEMHCWRGDQLYDAIKYGFRMRRQPLHLIITNAGDDLQSICYKQREKAQAILEGSYTDHRYHALIYSADKKEVLEELESVKNGATSLPVARKCNPSIDVILEESDLLADVKDALQVPREIPNLLRFTYGVWDMATDPWLDVEQFQACEIDWDDQWTIGRDCWIGLDLAKTSDTTAAVICYHDDDDNSYRMESRFWLPQASVEKYSHMIDYKEWRDSGDIKVTPGDVCDYNVVLDDLLELSENHCLQQILFDPYNAEHLMQQFEEQTGIERKVFPQTIVHFAEPTKEFERLILNKQLMLKRNDCWRFQASVVTVKNDVNNNIRPVKPSKDSIKKIDGIVAAVMSLGGAMSQPRNNANDLLVFGGAHDDE